MLRVVQWAIGNVGREAVAAVHRHPDLTLVGALVYEEAKAGRDVGEVCGIGPIGVTATTEVDTITALDADCALYMAQGEMNPAGALDDICALLASGKKRGVDHPHLADPPQEHGPGPRRPPEHAGATGRSSFHGTASNRGGLPRSCPSRCRGSSAASTPSSYRSS